MTTLKTILYFSIFNYPVTKEEIFEFSHCTNWESLEQELDSLIKQQVIYKIDDYYLKSNSPELVEKRLKGNKMAEAVMPKALKMADRISRFPYVRGVAISGGLSKGYFDKDGDVDFFIITAHKRLWIARTLLVLYKKIFLLNSKKYFCVNYFISENHLIIAEKNKFTATELVTLLPTHGKNLFISFFAENKWVQNYFPNKKLKNNHNEINSIKMPALKRFIETLFNTKLGNIIEQFFRRITINKWKSKFEKLDREEFEVAMKSTESVSKHHPNNFQKKVIETLNKRYSQVSENHQISLEPEHA